MEKFIIPAQPSLDPITVYLDNGRITVICACDSWTHYFGAFSGPFMEFLKGLYPDYLAGKFQQSSCRPIPKKLEKEYVFRISMAVLNHIKTPVTI
jgi:hypothetical protein